MDETLFDIDSDDLARAARDFPADRRAVRPSGPVSLADLSRSTVFGRCAWDEGGRL